MTTQYQRSRGLRLISEQLYALGFQNLRAYSLRPRHVEALVGHWQAQGLSEGTIKNRMAYVRWWAEKVNRVSAVPRDNTALGIERRVYVTNQSKAQALDARAETIPDPRIRASLALQAAFGLRRAESLKFQPAYADRVDRLEIKASWAKGGRARTIPVLTPEQRALLDQVRRLVGNGSLIPADRSYAQHLACYERAVGNAGLSKLHGLRHAYAQRRYLELTGWAAPAAGGPCSRQLDDARRQVDLEARLQISQELGHEREQITAVYLGR